ncbi:spermatogenesis-associated protein 2-like protein [Pithys albifrons albifrons]|uniref:spermatogenesis-associated protein 2-like protein n=1 Tax=Pithys albifrons albifrons TaxID=3385563 RepID=UPI003A5D1B21
MAAPGPEARALLAQFVSHGAARAARGQLGACRDPAIAARARRLLGMGHPPAAGHPQVPAAVPAVRALAERCRRARDVRALRALLKALELLELLSLNLLLCPWRREFRSLKTFTANFVYYIQSVLPDDVVKTVLEKIGYVATTATEFSLVKKRNNEETKQTAFEIFLARIECETILEMTVEEKHGNVEKPLQERTRTPGHQGDGDTGQTPQRGDTENLENTGNSETPLCLATQQNSSAPCPVSSEAAGSVKMKDEMPPSAAAQPSPREQHGRGVSTARLPGRRSDSQDFLSTYSDIAIRQTPVCGERRPPEALEAEPRACVSAGHVLAVAAEPRASVSAGHALAVAAEPRASVSAGHALAVAAEPRAGVSAGHALAVAAEPRASVSAGHALAVAAEPRASVSAGHALAVAAEPLGAVLLSPGASGPPALAVFADSSCDSRATAECRATQVSPESIEAEIRDAMDCIDPAPADEPSELKSLPYTDFASAQTVPREEQVCDLSLTFTELQIKDTQKELTYPVEETGQPSSVAFACASDRHLREFSPSKIKHTCLTDAELQSRAAPEPSSDLCCAAGDTEGSMAGSDSKRLSVGAGNTHTASEGFRHIREPPNLTYIPPHSIDVRPSPTRRTSTQGRGTPLQPEHDSPESSEVKLENCNSELSENQEPYVIIDRTDQGMLCHHT